MGVLLRSGLGALLLLLTLGGVSGQDSFSSEFQAELDAIEAAVEGYRALAPLAETSVTFPTADEVAVYLAERFDRDYPPERLDWIYLFYRALDLAEPGHDLRALMLEFSSGQIAGYYDSDAKTMQVVAGEGGARLDAPLKVTYAHEFAHALQDQHFDLAALGERRRDVSNLDESLAVTALVEGDASIVMDRYVDALLRADPVSARRELVKAQRAAASAPMPAGFPAVIEAEVEFMYLAGRTFAEAIHDAQGWTGVNHALAENPPTTSEQILHPERYLAGEGALAVEGVDASALIDEGWQLAYDDRVGEFYLRKHLELGLHPPYHARLADGWGGDRLQIFTREGQVGMLWVWSIVWDDAAEADEFVAGYGHYLERRGFKAEADGVCWVGVSARCMARVSAVETRLSMAAARAVARELLGAGG